MPTRARIAQKTPILNCTIELGTDLKTPVSHQIRSLQSVVECRDTEAENQTDPSPWGNVM
jgi:hypothetical protein